MVGLRFFSLCIIVIACSAPLMAKTSTAYTACSAKAVTQTALTSCAAEELMRTEHSLNVEYAKLIHAVTRRPEALAKVRAAERAWIAYRDATVEATFPAKAKQAEYGSIYPMEVDLVLADLTRQQTIALTNIIKAHSECGLDTKTGCIHPSPK
jgi:uncharacterized protein YecT (DUF1311 family)